MEKLYNAKSFEYYSHPQNTFYLSSYENGDAKIVIIDEERFYFTDSRYFEEVAKTVHGYKIEDISKWKSFHSDKIKEVGIENELTYEEYMSLKQSFPFANFHSISDRIMESRKVKNHSEIERLKKAQGITDAAFLAILGKIREGMTERELASELEGELFIRGGEALAFPSIVAFGRNTSKPHAHRTDKKLEKGDLITMDFGAKYEEYCSDMTRTVAFGKPSDEIAKVYDEVLNAQKVAIEGLYNGISGKDADCLARDYFAKQGLEKYFLHSLGHGVGIDIHEAPYLSPYSSDVLSNGMVFSIEPGLYFADKFGIRIEDVVYFEKNNIIDLTKSSKCLIIL